MKLIEDYKEEISAYNVMEFPEAAIWAIPEASIPLLAAAIEKMVREEAENFLTWTKHQPNNLADGNANPLYELYQNNKNKSDE